MIFASSSDTAVLVAAYGGLVVALATAFKTIVEAWRDPRERKQILQAVELTHEEIKATHEEVRTFNDLTVGQKSDADETRRIGLIAKEDRTEAENLHTAHIPPREEDGD